MRRRLRTAGWLLLALAALSVAVVVPVGAMRANAAAEFNLWVGWATVAAVPIAAMGVVLVLWDKVAKSNARVELSAADVETELAAVVLAQSQILRSRLIGIDEAGDQAEQQALVEAVVHRRRLRSRRFEGFVVAEVEQIRSRGERDCQRRRLLGQQVRFEMMTGRKGDEARNVMVI